MLINCFTLHEIKLPVFRIKKSPYAISVLRKLRLYITKFIYNIHLLYMLGRNVYIQGDSILICKFSKSFGFPKKKNYFM